MNGAVFLDRDGTLVEQAENPGDPAQVRLIRGTASAVASLRGLGYKVVVVTNQPAVAEGRCSEDDVAAVHDAINEQIRRATGASVDRFYFCPFHPEAKIDKYRKDHPWRKPSPGMLRQAARDMDIDLGQSWMIGDRPSDVAAGAAVGTRTILLTEDARTVTPAGPEHRDGERSPDFAAPSLIEAVKAVAQQRKPEAFAEIGVNPVAVDPPRPVSAVRAEDRAAPVPTAAAADAPPARPADTVDGPDGVAEPAPRAGVDSTRRTAASAARGADPVEGNAATQKLGQILQELRSQRIDVRQFSFLMGVAIVLQIIAGVCLLGALVMGAAEHQVFLRWIGSAVLVQLATIAMLLFDRR